MSFIDAHRDAYGVEPICEVLPITPSTYYEHKARQADTSRLPRDPGVIRRFALELCGCGESTSRSMGCVRCGAN